MRNVVKVAEWSFVLFIISLFVILAISLLLVVAVGSNGLCVNNIYRVSFSVYSVCVFSIGGSLTLLYQLFLCLVFNLA